MNTVVKVGWAVVFACFIASRLAVASATPEELQKQTDFKKAYASPDKAEHLKAVACLEGCTHDSSRQLLVTVVNVDQYKEVQIEAFKMLAQFPARDPSLSQLLVSLFNNLKLTDIEGRTAFVEAMKFSEFKYQCIEAMADYGSKLRYPDLVTNTGGNSISANGGSNNNYSGDPNVLRKKQRAEFEKYLAAFNLVTKANLTAADREAPAGMRKWLTGVRQKLMNDDKEALEKYRKEDQERLNKNNPLLPNKEKKDEKKEEKADEKKEDKKDEKKDDEKKEEKRDLVKDALEKKDEKKGEKKKTVKDE